ncbi:MAG: beta-ketoacyl-ACP synthase II [Candidatus Izemoplasmatales bacterium]|nr:beta-ketoacyl-ACP synthase II [Candidatus Izemoplasmatales bacterium]MDD5293695.1 beta-ketoacyl-ACP synthase II [Candidatus Izemoplasmatales bacterium]
MNHRRVVITGMGTINAIGNNVTETWDNAVRGLNGIGPITLFDASRQKPYLVGEVKDLQPDRYVSAKEAKRMDRTMLLGMAAAMEAYDDAGLSDVTIDRDRFGTYVTSGIGGLGTINEESKKAHLISPDRISPFFVPNSIINLVAGNIAIRFQALGPAMAVVTACSSATNAIGEAFRAIRHGYMDLAFCGGAEASLNEIGIGGFASMKAISPSLDIDRASIPFDLERSGFVMAEGAGVLILEELEHALNRHAKIHAEVIGYATNCDAFHITQPDENARGIIHCMRLALQDAQIEPEMIDYINPHGTSTYYNDRLESHAIREVFGAHADHINIGATKSMHAHALGAVGGIEAIISVKAIQNDIAPPTINYRVKDPECDLNYTPNHAVHRSITYALKNSLGFGGHNATLIFKKWRDEDAEQQ